MADGQKLMLNLQLLERAETNPRFMCRDKCVKKGEENRKHANHKRRSQEVEETFLDKNILLVSFHLVFVLQFFPRELCGNALSVKVFSPTTRSVEYRFVRFRRLEQCAVRGILFDGRQTTLKFLILLLMFEFWTVWQLIWRVRTLMIWSWCEMFELGRVSGCWLPEPSG